jgi:type IV secretory pathway ATPase VirB11/archaellum biosynthesis ATPase
MSENIIFNIKKEINTKTNKGMLLDWNDFLQISGQMNLNVQFMPQLRKWFELIFEQSFLDEIPKDSEEIFFHSSTDSEIKLASTIENYPHDIQDNDFELMLKVLTLQNSIQWNYSVPFCSFYFNHNNTNLRVSLVHKSLTSNNLPKGFFRILNKSTIPLSLYSKSEDLSSFIRKKKNILIAGATGSGKTTLINSLLSQIEQKEHTLILEDTFELISPNSKTTRLLANDRSDLDTLLTYGLRMSPDRIVLGELRSKEVTTFIQAMNTGHKGILSTIHANTASDALSRVALLFSMYSETSLSYELVLKLVCQNIDHVIYIEDKKITEVIDVFGSENSQVFFESLFKKKEVNNRSA